MFKLRIIILKNLEAKNIIAPKYIYVQKLTIYSSSLMIFKNHSFDY